MVVGLFWSEPKSGCANAVEAVRSVTKTQQAVYINIGSLSSVGNCFAVVHPGQIIKIEASPLPVVPTGNVRP
jgi:hydroxyethylthiazole kinase-like sugar kinase family protein